MYVLQFIANCKEKTVTKSGQYYDSRIGKAESLLVQDAQSTISQGTLERLSTQLGINREKCTIIWCKGRLNNVSVKFNTKRPILLPRDYHLSTLSIQDCHDKVMHNGTEETLLELRSRF